jgi:hypothetical protein
MGDTVQQATTTQGVMIHLAKPPGMKRRIKRSPLKKKAEGETRRHHHRTPPNDAGRHKPPAGSRAIRP